MTMQLPASLELAETIDFTRVTTHSPFQNYLLDCLNFFTDVLFPHSMHLSLQSAIVIGRESRRELRACREHRLPASVE